MGRSVTEAYLKEWFQKSSQYDKEAWESDDEASTGYRCAVTDVIAFICNNSSKIELSSEVDRHDISQRPGQPKYVNGLIHQKLTVIMTRTEPFQNRLEG